MRPLRIFDYRFSICSGSNSERLPTQRQRPTDESVILSKCADQ